MTVQNKIIICTLDHSIIHMCFQQNCIVSNNNNRAVHTFRSVYHTVSYSTVFVRLSIVRNISCNAESHCASNNDDRNEESCIISRRRNLEGQESIYKTAPSAQLVTNRTRCVRRTSRQQYKSRTKHISHLVKIYIADTIYSNIL